MQGRTRRHDPWNLRPVREPDPLTTVDGLNGSTYPRPDIAMLDSHPAALCTRLQHAAPQFPSLAEAFRTEIDRLLHRRLWLQLETRGRTYAAGGGPLTPRHRPA
jgi:hypothetical protein